MSTLILRTALEADRAAVIDLVLRIQNDEYAVGLSLADQPDLAALPDSYAGGGGAFWVADVDGAVVGCIGLMALDARVGVLKKFFVEAGHRGVAAGVATGLFDALLLRATAQGFRTLILDTPSVATRSHTFYRKAGFRQIDKSELPVPYAYPDRNSLLFRLDLGPAPPA
jgi:N-acetylglutamate synthase-like GNAT family acetyltransferase